MTAVRMSFMERSCNLMASPARQNQSPLRQVKAAVTEAVQSARTGTSSPAYLGLRRRKTWRSNSGVRSKCATRRRARRPPSPPQASIWRFGPRRNRKAEWARRHGAGKRAHHGRPDLAAVRGRWPQQAHGSRLDAGRRPAQRRPGGARSRARGETRTSPASRCFPIPSRLCATSTAPRRSTPTISCANRCAPSRRNFPASACSATWRSIPSPATAMTG